MEFNTGDKDYYYSLWTSQEIVVRILRDVVEFAKSESTHGSLRLRKYSSPVQQLDNVRLNLAGYAYQAGRNFRP